MYLVATLICVVSWLNGRDPFPGVADVFYSASIRAVLRSAVFHPGRGSENSLAQLTLDATYS